MSVTYHTEEKEKDLRRTARSYYTASERISSQALSNVSICQRNVLLARRKLRFWFVSQNFFLAGRESFLSGCVNLLRICFVSDKNKCMKLAKVSNLQKKKKKWIYSFRRFFLKLFLFSRQFATSNFYGYEEEVTRCHIVAKNEIGLKKKKKMSCEFKVTEDQLMCLGMIRDIPIFQNFLFSIQ